MERATKYLTILNRISLFAFIICVVDFIEAIKKLGFNPTSAYIITAIIVLLLGFFAWALEESSTWAFHEKYKLWISSAAWTLWCFVWLGMIFIAYVSAIEFIFSYLFSYLFFDYFIFFALYMLLANLIITTWSWLKAIRNI